MGLGSSGALRTAFVCSVIAFVLIACGSGGDSSNFVDGKEQSVDPNLPGPLGSSPDAGPAEFCKKQTCQDQGVECGPAGDGCGGILPDCGTCPTGKRCGGPNAYSKCVDPAVGTACAPKTCQQLGVECGQAGDGCGGILACGTCPSGQQCGSTASPSKCVAAVATGPDGGACVPKTKAEYNAEGKDCGDQSDNCGGTVALGNCIAPEFCGGGGPSSCAVSGGGACTKKICADYPGKCGPQSDGCGGVTANCGTCTFPEVCGGGGTASVCGGGKPTGAGGGACVPKTTCAPGQCGMIADGCGGVLDCGNTCGAGTLCGGGGTPNVCGAPDCKPIAACPAGMNCGAIANGCGGTILCGSGAACAFPQIGGGGGQPNVCGGGSVTGDGGAGGTPKTCAQTGRQCGPVADGCGGVANCPACTSPEICGGGGAPSMCGGANQCTPKTVANCPANGCGWIADGCGGLVQCGTCTGGAICGASTPNVCGTGSGAPCTGFCLNQVTTCGVGSSTRITGKVYAPNATLPIPGAVVYVPNGAATTPYGVTPIASGVSGGSCDQCNQTASGSPLVSTTSNADGSFTLNNVPAGVSFPIVIQLGKWRRMVTVGPVTACGNVALSASQTRLPTRQNEGQNGVDNIPFMAVSTGQVDGLECVLRKIGIEDTQFGNPPGTTATATDPALDRGRVRLNYDEDDPNTYARGGAVMNVRTPSTDIALTDTQGHLDQYDAVIFGCPGDANTRSSAILDRVRGYADKGGRVFATHYNYVYLSTNAPWSATTAWDTANERSAGNGSAAIWTGEINTGSAKRLLFSQWLNAPGVSALTASGPPRIDITEPRNNADRSVAAGAEEWITRYNDPGPGSTGVLHYTFNTPWGSAAASQCGRVLFSDFHVSIGNTYNLTFPTYCGTGGLTNQEKILAFFLFDLTSCIQTAPPPTCTPKTCANYPSGTCGTQSDGCGGTTANCGTCLNGQTCGGAGAQNQCGGPTCTKKTCAFYNAECGTVPDGCGGTVNCPPCAGPGEICGGGGVAYQCGASSCAPKTCQQLGIQCGQSGDGCGNLITCPPCPPGTTCGGGGVANACGAPACTPATMCPAGMNCGDYPNGCGGSIHCGDCPPGLTCGGGGAPNVCGAASCTPKTCAQQGAQCGSVAMVAATSSRAPTARRATTATRTTSA
jgi:hypothetical protein